MKAEIIAVGDEILLGDINNKNAQSMSAMLASVGIEVEYHTAVGDDVAKIASVLKQALHRCDVVVLTGGLGPTHDDLTREGISAATGRELKVRADLEDAIRAKFKSMNRKMSPINIRQAEVPVGALPLPNPIGTAPGIQLEVDGKLVFAVPGVPPEMTKMMRDHVLPVLSQPGSGRHTRVLRIAGMGESDVGGILQEALDGAAAWAKEYRVAVLTKPGEVFIKITRVGTQASKQTLDEMESKLREVFGSALYGVDNQEMESVIQGLLRDKGLTLGIAESVTGGMVASRLVSAAGASQVFKAGFVTYSRQSKADLGVPSDLLARGMVSQAVAVSMAERARTRSSSDVGLATTGEAGPDSLEAPVGTVHLGLAWESGSTGRSFTIPGDREVIRARAAMGALNLLRLWLLGEIE